MRILIVDDEPMEREGLAKILTRACSDWEIEQAKNGRIAIDIANTWQPHIVLMDIMMPGMTGLEAIEVIQQQQPRCQFIVVTAFETFEYAHQALKLGVKDYILKPSRAKEIVAVVQKVVETVERTEQHVEPMLEQAFVTQLLSKQLSASRFQVYAEPFHFPTHRHFAVLVVLFENISENIEYLRRDLNDDTVFIGALYDKQLPIVLPITDDFRTQTIRVATALQTQLGDDVKAITISEEVRDWQDIPEAYEQALHAMAYIQKSNQIVYIADCKIEHVHAHDNWQQVIASLDWPAMNALISTLFKSEQPVEQIERQLFEWIWELHLHLKEQGVAIGAPTIEWHHTSRQQLKENVQQYIEGLQLKLKKHQESDDVDKMEQAKRYIAKHYATDMSLEKLAEHLQLHPIYMSKLFKERLGVNYIDYLTDIRMTKAKRFLANPSLSMKEIAIEVGYRDPNYFSKVFKKLFGMSPLEYRKQVVT